MAVPPAAPDRQFKHRRNIDVRIYSRGNGLWEVDAHLTDVRDAPVELAAGTLPAGEPIHDMLLRLVVDEGFNVVEAGAETMRSPYPGECDTFGDAYGRLVGLNLLQGFRREVSKRLGGVAGCTHLSELSQVLPTAVVQAFAGSVIDTRGDAATAARPFQIDRCRALRVDGDAVRTHYPRWYEPAQPNAGAFSPATPATEAARP